VEPEGQDKLQILHHQLLERLEILAGNCAADSSSLTQ